MYNLLITANEDEWEKGYSIIDRSRFLEYTNKDIAEKFEILDEENIEKLKSYPCLFAYEGILSRDARVGYLTDIKAKGSNKIYIAFEFSPKSSPINYSEIHSISDLLDIRDWEINRTHWAVKDEDLFKCLKNAGLLIGLSSEQIPYTSSKSEKNFRSKASNENTRSVRGLVDRVLRIGRLRDKTVFYRGHSSSQYKLEPYLFRKDDDGNYLYLHKEDVLYRELIVSNSVEFASDDYTLDKLVRMQHFSLPTRLLDITSNPLIALYFACKSKPDEDGEFIFITVRDEIIKYYDSDTAGCIANLARLPKSEKDGIDLSKSKSDFNLQSSVLRLLHFIKEEKPYFENKIEPSDLQKIICIKGKKSNDRISSQSGAFMLFGFDAILSETGTDDIEVKRITIPKKAKPDILEELDLFNINESTVFPYIENSARYVANKYRFRKP